VLVYYITFILVKDAAILVLLYFNPEAFAKVEFTSSDVTALIIEFCIMGFWFTFYGYGELMRPFRETKQKRKEAAEKIKKESQIPTEYYETEEYETQIGFVLEEMIEQAQQSFNSRLETGSALTEATIQHYNIKTNEDIKIFEKIFYPDFDALEYDYLLSTLKIVIQSDELLDKGKEGQLQAIDVFASAFEAIVKLRIMKKDGIEEYHGFIEEAKAQIDQTVIHKHYTNGEANG